MNEDNGSWYEFYFQGRQYMKTAENGLTRSEVFTPVVIYNIASMAIEKMIMAVSILHGELPACHTLAGMARSAGNIMGFDDRLIEDMVTMDSMQMICTADEVCCTGPGIEDVAFFIDVMRRVYTKTEIYLKSGNWNDRAQAKHYCP